MEKVRLQNLNRGAVADLFDEEFTKILANIEDENTDAKAVRSLTIKLEIKPDETRSYGTTKLAVTSKLAAISPSTGFMFFDIEDGKFTAFEDNPKQEPLDFAAAQIKVN